MKSNKRKQVLHIMRGLPGSGKSTKSNQLLGVNHKAEPDQFPPVSMSLRRRVFKEPKMQIIRVNRDCLRKMLWPEAKWRTEFEKVVVRIEKAIVKAGLKAKLDVIVDDTNLGPMAESPFLPVAADVKIHDFSGVDVETCLFQNEGRRGEGGNFCSPEIIVKLARKHGLLGKVGGDGTK